MRMELVLNKNCRNFDRLDWYIRQHLAVEFGGYSYMDGKGGWIDSNRQLIEDDNRYYVTYHDDAGAIEIFENIVLYVLSRSHESAIFYVVDGKGIIKNRRGNVK